VVKKTSKSEPKRRVLSLGRNKKTRSDAKVGYFRGAWRELRLVRWPDRRATWGLTIAVIIFSVFFAVLIISLDYGFNELIRKVLL